MLTAICLVPIFFWRENYGSSDGSVTMGEEHSSHAAAEAAPQSMVASLKASVKLIMEQPIVLCLGLSQACFEGAVFTFGKP